ncbi:hypothetical protein B0H13DRAFT_1611416 [Mycena leptocephala]|nr:hypothetical protein B0H13DRAFT_1611416 [Mycena leptocephala]
MSYTPSHSDFVVVFKPGNFASFLKASRRFAQGDTLAVMNNTIQSKKSYASLHCGRGSQDIIEFNSDLVYGRSNHSCEPNVAVDLSSADPANWHVRALKDIEAGSPITWFYPSTEWEMVQPFECQCGAKSCLGLIQGAKHLRREEVVGRGWVNPWIEELMGEREKV